MDDHFIKMFGLTQKLDEYSRQIEKRLEGMDSDFSSFLHRFDNLLEKLETRIEKRLDAVEAKQASINDKMLDLKIKVAVIASSVGAICVLALEFFKKYGLK